MIDARMSYDQHEPLTRQIHVPTMCKTKLPWLIDGFLWSTCSGAGGSSWAHAFSENWCCMIEILEIKYKHNRSPSMVIQEKSYKYMIISYFFFYICLPIFLFLVIWRLPLWTDSKAQTLDICQAKTQTCAVLVSSVWLLYLIYTNMSWGTHQVSHDGRAFCSSQLGLHKWPLLFQ